MGVKSRNYGVSEQTASLRPKVESQTTPASSAKGSQPTEGEPEGYEFGGPLVAALILVASPLLMWYMWIGATYYEGQLPLKGPGQTWGDFGQHLVHLVYEGAFPTAKAWAVYWTFGIWQALMYCYMPGVMSEGRPLWWEGGRKLPYYCSAYTSFYATLGVVAILHVTGLFPLTTIIDEVGSIMSVAIISGFLASIVVYLQAFVRGTTARLSGNVIYDFFMGAELNPRIGILDFKMFYEVRIPWFILFLITSSVATRQYETHGYVSAEVIFLLMAHYLYANACAKAEEKIITSWDMYYEKLGWMLTFWNMAGVPFIYCHCSLYLANHDPSEYRCNRYVLAALTILYLFFYWMWDTANSQRSCFRQMERGKLTLRNTFPQLPWQYVKNPRAINTRHGDRIMVDGWFGIVRKPNYPPDMFFAFSWGFITGVKSPFPWFYFPFFMGMIIHRTYRDAERCRKKYGEAWKQYEKEVPYLFIPYLI